RNGEGARLRGKEQLAMDGKAHESLAVHADLLLPRALLRLDALGPEPRILRVGRRLKIRGLHAARVDVVRDEDGFSHPHAGAAGDGLDEELAFDRAAPVSAEHLLEGARPERVGTEGARRPRRLLGAKVAGRHLDGYGR